MKLVGNCQPCGPSDIEISQSKTGKKVQNKPEWKVTIQNKCVCTQQDIELDCKGFQTTEPIDPSILAVNQNATGECLIVKDGGILHGSRVDQVVFNYAWDTQFPFKAIATSSLCS